MIAAEQYLIGVAELARRLESGIAFAELASHFEARVRHEPADASALLDLSTLLFWSTDPDNRRLGFARQQQALQLTQVYRLRPRSAAAALRVMVVMAPGDMTANTPVDCLLEEGDIDLTLCYALPSRPLPGSLPDHDLIFVAIGQSERTHILLRQLHALSELSRKPVVNLPEKIQLLTRTRVAALLHSIPGTVVPPVAQVGRQYLLNVGQENLSLGKVLAEGRYPIIVRPIDSHGGRELAKIDGPAELLAHVTAHTDNEFYASNFVDYRSPDGQFRKYRLVMFGGRVFPCHMAISSHWMVHYFNAAMGESAAKRHEEARFMDNFATGFADKHGESLRAIFDRVGLDYIVLDCGEMPDGSLLVFEIDNAAIVHALDDAHDFPYKRPQMQKVFAAFREMLLARARDWTPQAVVSG